MTDEIDELPVIHAILTDEQVRMHVNWYYHRANALEHKLEVARMNAGVESVSEALKFKRSPRDTEESFDDYQARLIAEGKLDQLEEEAKQARFRACEYAGQLLLRQRERESR